MRDVPKANQIYRHFKGGLYQIICVAEDSGDSLDALVVYRSLFPPYSMWSRELEIFLSEVEVSADGNLLAQSHRFELIRDLDKISLSSVPTEVLIEELLKRADSPIMSSELLENDNIFSDEIVVADTHEMPRPSFDDIGEITYENFCDILVSFHKDGVEEAQDWLSRHPAPRRRVMRNLILKLDF